MAKSKTKKVSLHSRAARRATSPSIDTDKSLKNVKAPLLPGSNIVRHAGASKTGAGISKRGRKSVKTREQRLRLEKAMLRAETVMDQMGKKMEGSRRKNHVVKDRSGAWDDINGRIKRREKKSQNPIPDDENADDDWEDAGDSDEEQMIERVGKLKVRGSATPMDPNIGKSLVKIDDDEDEIL